MLFVVRSLFVCCRSKLLFVQELIICVGTVVYDHRVILYHSKVVSC